MAIPRYRQYEGPAVFSAGFRPFFLLGAAWAAIAVPLWLLAFAGQSDLPTQLAPAAWHVHEMVFGYGAAIVAGFLLTAIPNWTGRLPLQGRPLAALVLLWMAGLAAALVDLAFPLIFLAVVAREIIAGRNWRNLPMLGALALLLLGNLLVHIEALGLAKTAAAGNRLGVATLLMLISFVGGRVVPSFTRNWLARLRPETAAPATFGMVDRIALSLTGLALALWVILPDGTAASSAELAAALALAARLLRWRGQATAREPLLWVLHVGYGWLALGFLLLAVNGFTSLLPPTTALHALTVGAIGTVTLAMMTRVSLGHTGRPLTAGSGTVAIYGLVTLAAFIRLLAPLGGTEYLALLSLAGAAWCGAFGLFLVFYFRPLVRPRIKSESARPA